jgi:hypothetical protein
MLIRAENDPKFSRKFLFMGILAVGFALYCLYDGLVGYPGKRVQGFENFKVDYRHFPDTSYTSMTLAEFEEKADRKVLDDWTLYARESDIPAHANIVMQFIMAAITGATGLYLISIPLRSRGHWIEMDDEGVRSSWGEGFQFDQVELLNKRRWRNKGIAKVTYVDGSRKRRFVIDDFKFKRDPTDTILYELEQRIGLEKIVNGPPEPPPGEHADDAGMAPPASAEGTA